MDVRQELKILINANYSLIHITTWEEVRALAEIRDISTQTGRTVVTWSLTKGFQDPASHIPPGASEHKDPSKVMQVLQAIEGYANRAVFVLRDFHPFMTGQGSPLHVLVSRQLRDMAEELRTKKQTLIFLSPRTVFPPDLEKEIIVLSFPLPDAQVLRELLCKTLTQNASLHADIGPAEEERIVQALRGLTYVEAENALFKALATLSVSAQRLEPSTLEQTLKVLLTEKEQVIRKSGTLEFYPAQESLKSVGGLENLKDWLEQRRTFFGGEAVSLGLPRPKGVLLLGLPGCGKSLMAKAISATWNLPLLKLDMGSIFGQYVGQSEENMRRALNTAEAVAPSVLWADEIEKAFAHAGGDGGVGARVFGAFLTWMQEQTHGVFVVATANDISQLPPELMRKGRFDEMFFVGNPQPKEREEIFRCSLKRLDKRLRLRPEDYDFSQLSQLTRDFSGAEIASAVQEAAGMAFQENRKVANEDIARTIKSIQPLAQTFKDRLDIIQAWARRCVPASRPEPVDDSELGPIQTRTLG